MNTKKTTPQAPAPLPDPIHHGDIFSRIEATQEAEGIPTWQDPAAAPFAPGDIVTCLGQTTIVRHIDWTDEGWRCYLANGGWAPAAWLAPAPKEGA